MIFNTQLELNITIKDINAIYSTDYETMLIDHAKAMYEGKCYGGQYVNKIVRLVRRSLANLIKRDLDAKVRVYVVVEAEVIRYDQYDIITGLVVERIVPAGKLGDYGILECSNKHVVALTRIHGNQHIGDLSKGDIIPIRVGQTLYRIANTHILVNGYPFVPYVPDRIYASLPRMTPEIANYYDTMVKPLLDREIKRKSELDQKQWEKFSKLLHPYKSEPSKAASIASKGVSILDAQSLVGTLSVDDTINMSELMLSTAPGDMLVNESAQSILTRLGFRYVKWLEVINDLTTQYPDDASFDKVKGVWQLYEQHKL